MQKSSKIYIAGHRGLVGSAILRALENQGYTNILTRTSKELDLTDQQAVGVFFEEEQPEFVFLAAAKVGGIVANSTTPADFIRINLQIQTNIIENSRKTGVKKLLFLGSSCIYPKMSPQPIREEYLLTGPLEPTNDAYAVAKIAGIQMCKAYNKQYGTNYISVMPTNLYGPNDTYDLENSHVLPALIRRFHEAKMENKPSVTAWGTGSPRREFLHVDDLADACIFLMQKYDNSEIINVGTGTDVTIKELTELVARIVDYTGTVEWDTSKPDGTPRKLLDVSKLHTLGWRHATVFKEGVTETYKFYISTLQQ